MNLEDPTVRPLRRPHVVLTQSADWRLELIQDRRAPWCNLRLVRTRRHAVVGPRNVYWLAWHTGEQRWADSNDYQHARQHVPHMLDHLAARLGGDLAAQLQPADER